MTGRPRPSARCSGCGRDRLVTTAGLIGRHRNGQHTCAGAGQRPASPTPKPPQSPRPIGFTTPPPPADPADGRSCDGGGCDMPSVGWRLYRSEREWLPVCGLHMEGPPGRTRIYDPPEADRA